VCVCVYIYIYIYIYISFIISFQPIKTLEFLLLGIRCSTFLLLLYLFIEADIFFSMYVYEFQLGII
jgi:hypothetical protein